MRQTPELPFILTTGVTGPDSKTQAFIRSHVMKGKNKGKSYRSKRKDVGNSMHAGVATRGTSPKQGPTIWDCRPLGFIPKRVGSELGFVPFADEVESSLAAPVVKFTSLSKAALFPLESCIDSAEPPRASWVETLCKDAAYLNATIFSVQVYFDLLAGHDLEPVSPLTPTYTSFSKTIRLLRERLEEDDAHLKLSDNTVMVVLTLACHAHRLGQYSTARNHMIGLRKIIDMRGGIEALKTRTKLLTEMFRCDLGMALHSGDTPIFFSNGCIEKFLPYPTQLALFIPTGFRSHEGQLVNSQDLGITNVEVASAWETMQAFCLLINYTAASERKIPQQLFLDTMASTLYRLVSMKFPIESVDEAVRLGLSAFCSHVFLQWSNARLPHRYLPTMYKECLAEHMHSDMASSTLMPWLVMVGAMAVFPKGDTWLEPWLRRATGMSNSGTPASWGEVRASMKTLLWVDFVHDRCGAAIYHSVNRPSPLDAGGK